MDGPKRSRPHAGCGSPANGHEEVIETGKSPEHRLRDLLATLKPTPDQVCEWEAITPGLAPAFAAFEKGLESASGLFFKHDERVGVQP
jgi:hypothetical protein